MKEGLVRLLKDDSGLHSVEIALGIALIAAIAGFGMIALGDALAEFFTEAGSSFQPGSDFPSQDDSEFEGLPSD